MAAIDLVKCNSCGQMRRKVRGRYRKTGRGYVYLDERGRWWCSGVCPDCNTKKTIRVIKLKKERAVEPIFDLGIKLRSCRVCSVKTTNYFMCAKCHTNRSDVCWDMSLSYGGSM